MKIVKVEDLHCDAGWRVTSFLKITTDDGIVGWSEYIEDYGGHGVTGVIHKLAERLIGQDPRPVEVITHSLYVTTRHATGGINQQAIAAIENALVDIKAKTLGIPVYELLGGPLRDRLELYWSHCGTYRVRHAKRIKEWTGAEPVRSLNDLAPLGEEVARRGFRALKTNVVCFDGDPPFIYKPSKGSSGAAGTEFNVGRGMVEAAVRQLDILRKGAGPGVGLHLDIGFNYKTDGNLRIARALEPFDLTWLEIDTFDPDGLALVRSSARTPIASGESLYGRRQYRHFFEKQAVDVAIVDVLWNGVLESVKIANMADAFEVDVAPHNFSGSLATAISAHMSAAIANFRVMEIDIDDVSWKDQMVTVPPVIEDGHLLLPSGPGWGTEVDELFVRAHPPRR